MTIADIILISVGLAMDAAAVSMTNGMVYRNLRKRTYAAMPVFFGAFQALMPVLGFYAGGLFASIITRFSGIVIFIILGIIGGKMIKEGIDDLKAHETCADKLMTLKVLLFQSVATSIDAFAVGIGFSAMGMEIWMPAAIIGIVTAIIVVAAILIGRKFGDMLGCRAEILGGVILVIIGIKALI
ncbi:MAG: manganese efflux pump MntP family protein [Lentihominibacter sp.]